MERSSSIGTRSAPSFEGYTPSNCAASAAKRNNPSTGTLPEMLLRKALWREGARYRVNASWLPGKPDIVFIRAKVAVFCDGDFWHGRKWSTLRDSLSRGSNGKYWVCKIEANRDRDRVQEQQLRDMGWLVLRFWESEIRESPARIAELVMEVIHPRLPVE